MSRAARSIQETVGIQNITSRKADNKRGERRQTARLGGEGQENERQQPCEISFSLCWGDDARRPAFVFGRICDSHSIAHSIASLIAQLHPISPLILNTAFAGARSFACEQETFAVGLSMYSHSHRRLSPAWAHTHTHTHTHTFIHDPSPSLHPSLSLSSHI